MVSQDTSVNVYQLFAIATYSDLRSSLITNSVTWISDDTNIATVTATGLLSGVELGNTAVMAVKDGVTSDKVNVRVDNLAGSVIDILDRSGKLFTSSPSVAYLDSIGGSVTNGFYVENGTKGPAGEFYKFTQPMAVTLCETYNTHIIGGRTNWQLATKDELQKEIYNVFGDMFPARGWPTTNYYWSATPDGSYYYYVVLYIGYVSSVNPSYTVYASCVSKP